MTGIAGGSIDAEVVGNTGWITINNPARRNALSVAMMRTLDRTLRELDADPCVRAMVLRGNGDVAFAAGADITEFEGQHNSAEAKAAADEATVGLFGGLAALSTPVIAAIRGYCFGAGVALALGADIRIAARDSSFGVPAARLGVGYPVVLTRALTYAVGPGRASDILFTGRTMQAQEAFDIGLVDRLLAPEEIMDATAEMAETITQNAPLSVRAAKAAVKSVVHPEERPRAEALVVECVSSADSREGQRAFIEKRRPRFIGR